MTLLFGILKFLVQSGISDLLRTKVFCWFWSDYFPRKMVIFELDFDLLFRLNGEFGPRFGRQIGNGVNSVTDVTSLYNRCVCGNIKLA